jgi:hypothetical protein
VALNKTKAKIPLACQIFLGVRTKITYLRLHGISVDLAHVLAGVAALYT